MFIALYWNTTYVLSDTESIYWKSLLPYSFDKSMTSILCCNYDILPQNSTFQNKKLCFDIIIRCRCHGWLNLFGNILPNLLSFQLFKLKEKLRRLKTIYTINTFIPLCMSSCFNVWYIQGVIISNLFHDLCLETLIIP